MVRPHEHVQDVPAGRVIEQLTRGEVPQHNIHRDAVQHELAVAETHLVDRAEQQIDVAAMHGLLDRDEDVLVFFQATGALNSATTGSPLEATRCAAVRSASASTAAVSMYAT